MAQPVNNVKLDREPRALDLVPIRELIYGGVGTSEYVGHLLMAGVPFRVNVAFDVGKRSGWRGTILFDRNQSLPIINRIHASTDRYIPIYLPPTAVTTTLGEKLICMSVVKQQLCQGSGTRVDLILAAIKRLVTLVNGCTPRTVCIQFGRLCSTYLWASEVDEIEERYLFARRGRPLFQLRHK